jgi:hypothetical protein
VCGAILANNLYIKSTTQFICECVGEEFERDPFSAVEKLEKFWEKNHPIVGLSVGYKEIDRISDLIIDLKIYQELENHPEIMRTRELIIESAKDISRLERFELENLV